MFKRPGAFYPGHHAEIEMRAHAAALVDGTSGKTVTYRELDDDAWRVAHFYRSLGVNSGETLALCMDNSIEYVELIWGAKYAGVFFTPISTKLKVDEITYIVRDSGARVLLVSSAVPTEIRSGLHAELDDVCIVELDTDAGLPDMITSQAASRLPELVEGIPLLYSSGTTGRPKGIRPALPPEVLGHNMSPLVGALPRLFGDSSSVYLSPAPLYHAAPLGYVLTAGQLGATAVIMRRFDAAEFLRQVARYHATHTQVVPTMFARLLQLPQPVRDAADVTSLECVIHAGAPCPPTVKRAMFDWLGPIIHEYYSGSEGFGFVYCSPEDWWRHPGSVGKSLAGAIHIVDDDGREVPPGTEGLIYFESPQRIEYLGDPEKTRDAFNEKGWATFGDVGWIDPDGFLYIVDRRTDMIISGGVNVYPRETEETLMTHPAVRDAAVIGLPDEDLGQRVVAVVSVSGRHTESRMLAGELIEHCRVKMSHIKCPQEIFFVEELPRTDTGKLLRRKVRESFRARENNAEASLSTQANS